MSGPDLVMHVGMSRSTAIARPALQRLRPQLRAAGVSYVGAHELARLPHASGWRRGRTFDSGQQAAFRREVVKLVDAERRRAGAPGPVLVSGSELLGAGEIGFADTARLRPDAESAVSDLVKALSARSVRIVLHTQRQDHLLESAYLRWLRRGNHARIETFFPDPHTPVVDYLNLVERLRSVRGVVDVVVRPIELADAGMLAFVNDLLGAVGLRDTLNLYAVGADARLHPTMYSSRGAALARAMNPLVDGIDELTLVQDFLLEHHHAQLEYGPPEILDSDARDELLSRYADANRALFEQCMPDLPADSYADDVRTFALANVVQQPRFTPRPAPATARPTPSPALTTLARRGRQLARRGRQVARRLGIAGPAPAKTGGSSR